VSFISAQDKINDLLSLGPANGGTQDKYFKISAGQANTPLRINFGGARDQETPKILVIFGVLTPYVHHAPVHTFIKIPLTPCIMFLSVLYLFYG
jgi:hypothetical protein